MNKNNFFVVLTAISFVVSTIIAIIIYAVITTNELNNYKEYFNNTEKVLDETYNCYDSFLDTIGETDTYYEYELIRNKILGK